MEAAAAAGREKKPWRYYCVMAFPNSSKISEEKVRLLLPLVCDMCETITLEWVLAQDDARSHGIH